MELAAAPELEEVEVGTPVQSWSETAGVWCDGTVTELFEGDLAGHVKVTYYVGEKKKKKKKTVELASEELRILPRLEPEPSSLLILAPVQAPAWAAEQVVAAAVMAAEVAAAEAMEWQAELAAADEHAEAIVRTQAVVLLPQLDFHGCLDMF